MRNVSIFHYYEFIIVALKLPNSTLDITSDRKWENQRADIRDDPFISSLIMKGEFDSDFLETSALIHDKVSFETLFSSSSSSSDI